MTVLSRNMHLKDDQDFDFAIHFNATLSVWQGSRLLETGAIDSYTSDALRIDGVYFIRQLCAIKVVDGK